MLMIAVAVTGMWCYRSRRKNFSLHVVVVVVVMRTLVFDWDYVAADVVVVFGEVVAASEAPVAVAAVEGWVWEEVSCPPIALTVD